MAAGNFYVWVTLLSEAGVDHLLASLIRRRFTVEPLGRNGELVTPGNFSALCALNVVHRGLPQENAITWVVDQIVEVLAEKDYRYFSLVVVNPGGSATWRGSNIQPPSSIKKQDVPVTPSLTSTTQLDRMDAVLGEYDK